MKIPFVDFKKSYKQIEDEVLPEIKRVLSGGDYILRDDVEKFEKNLARYTKTKHAIGVNSGTDALILSLDALGIGPGDEVITSGYTFWATVEAIIRVGATPILADIGEDLLIDPEDIKKKITKKTKAIIPVHIGGAVCDMEAIKKIAGKRHIIEDSAQALGATNLTGDTACYSFYPAKVLGGYGDGGAIVTNDNLLADKLKLMRNHGGKPYPKFVGYNSRLDNLQATILNVRLKTIEGLITRRKDIARIYFNSLFTLQAQGKVILPKSTTFQEYNIKTKDRYKLYKFLEEKGIETLKGEYIFPIDQPPKAKKANSGVLRLPIWPTLTDNEIEYVCKTIEKFYV